MIDDWSGFGNFRDQCVANLERFRGRSRVRVIEQDCFEVDPGELGRYDLYLYDGGHHEDQHYRAIVAFHPYLDDEAVVLVDDWNWRPVRNGTERALAEIPFEILLRHEITAPESPREEDGKIVQDPRSWWNGLACFVLRRR